MSQDCKNVHKQRKRRLIDQDFKNYLEFHQSLDVRVHKKIQ